VLDGAAAPEQSTATTGGVTAPDEPVVSEPPTDPDAAVPLSPAATDPAPVQSESQTGETAPATPAAEPAAEDAAGADAPAPPPAAGVHGRSRRP
jgi:hypothetical protein